MISAVNYWLHRLGINCFKVHCKTVKHSLLVDRLRNGIILCDLAVLLEPKLTQSLNFFDCVNYNPSNVMDCKINLCAALNVFKGAKCPPIHAKLLIDPETIMIGGERAKRASLLADEHTCDEVREIATDGQHPLLN